MPQVSPEKRHSRGSMPAPPTKVKEYILRVLDSGEAMKRDELVSRARALAPVDGFVLDGRSAITTGKKALSLLAKERRIESPRVGWWRIATSPDSPLAPPDVAEPEDQPEPEPRITIEREIGTGPESVYVYYHDTYAELARSKGSPVWECKVGSTFGPPDARVIGQGALTQFPRPPIIGLVIKTENGRGLERALHIALTLAGKRIEGGGGSEWFVTSPDQIERWVLIFWDSLKTFVGKDSSDIQVGAPTAASISKSLEHRGQL